MSEFLIYKSSAGSGKTTALIQIFLKLSLQDSNPAQFKKILAVTFTNKAAQEMKDRLMEELQKLSTLPESYSGGDFMIDQLIQDTGQNSALLSQKASAMFRLVLHDYNDLSIGTIDQFNHRLIRGFSRDLQLKSDFEVELQEAPLFEEAVDRIIDRVGSDPFITQHLLRYVKLKLDEEKKSNLHKDLANFRQLITSEEGLVALVALKSDPNKDYKAIAQALRAEGEIAAEKIRELGRSFLQFIDLHGLTVSDFHRKANGIGGFFVKLSKFPEVVINLTDSVRKFLTQSWLNKSVKKDIRQKYEPIESELQNMLDFSIRAWQSAASKYHLTSRILSQIDLVAVLETLSDELDLMCIERNILPISKFNKLISEALRKEPVAFLYENYGMRFNHILIDEYQDTSELQWFNLLPLIEESLSKGYTNLVVGDAKQSIYRWRGGKAEQLISLPKLLDTPQDLGAAVEATLMRTQKIVSLNTNYRSKPSIVEFNNLLFSELGVLATSANTLYQKEYAADAVSQKFRSNKDAGYVQVNYLGSDAKPEDKWDNLYAQIQLALGAGYEFGDMAILVRSTSKEGREIVSRLRKENIPVSTASSFEIDKNVYVKLVMAFMRLVHDPILMSAKVMIMRCMDEILGCEFKPQEFAGKNDLEIERYLESRGKPPLTTCSTEASAFDLLQCICTNYLPNINDPFLNALSNVVIQQTGFGGSLADFFDWWDKLREKPSIPGGRDDNAIQLMTIHKAKGLQFKAVFVPDLNWKFRPSSKELKWFKIAHAGIDGLPYIPLPINSKLKDMGFQEDWKTEEAANRFDNLNMVYVALTRAAECLFISYTSIHYSSVGSWIHAVMSKLLLGKDGFLEGYLLDGDLQAGYAWRSAAAVSSETPERIESVVEGLSWQSAGLQPWSQRINIADQSISTERLFGDIFHRIIARSNTLAKAHANVLRLEQRAEISAEESTILNQMMTALFTDKRFSDLMTKSQKLAERNIFYNGSVLRPDLVFESDSSLVIIDFKTGSEEEDHLAQVSRYSIALQAVSKKRVQPFLLYFNPLRWKAASS